MDKAAHINSWDIHCFGVAKFTDDGDISRNWSNIWYTIQGVAAICYNDDLKIMKSKPRTLVAFIISLVITAACGQKGPLFLPGTPSTIQSTVPEQQPTPVEETEKDDEEQTDNIN